MWKILESKNTSLVISCDNMGPEYNIFLWIFNCLKKARSHCFGYLAFGLFLNHIYLNFNDNQEI